MRILVLQLARFGDIYQTWPALKAIQRLNPTAELHVLVRQRFREALNGIDGLVVHSWPTAEILEPIYMKGNESEAHERLQKVLAPLRALEFHRIVNLSFSPMSSFLADILSHGHTVTTGYTRFEDGFLNIPDDASAYFFAQGEIGKSNRFHITQIFSLVAQSDLIEEDFRAFAEERPRKNQVVVHLGASQSLRLYPAQKWVQVLRAALAQGNEDWILVGSPEEMSLAESVSAHVAHARLKNQVGQSRLPELMNQLAESKLFVGCDSAPAQMASLTQTPILQLTSLTANFWTTGPTSAGSRVIYSENLADISPDRIAAEARAMLNGEAPLGPCAIRLSALRPYELHDLNFNNFSWQLIEALYTQSSYPEAETQSDLLAFQRLFEVSELALEQVESFKIPERRKTSSLILANVDQMIAEIGRLNPRVNPLIQWFETERLRIPPGKAEDTLEAMRRLFSDLQTISSVYRRYDEPGTESKRAIELARRCLPAIRDFRMASVQDDFQSLLSTLQELSRHSTKVGEQQWAEMLGGLNEALGRRDFIEVADQLEYVLIPALS